MTERSDIIGNGTDGFGDSAAGRGDFHGRTTSDPAEAETDSGSFSSPPVPSGAGGDAISTSAVDGAPDEASSSAARPPAGEGSPDARSSAEGGDVSSGAGSDGELIDAEGVIEGEIDELAAIVSERNEYKDLALRAKADFENYRKRADRRVAETRGSAIAGVVRELLPVIDNLDRAVEAATAGTDGDAFADGVRLVHADLHSVLDRLGLTAVDPAGEQFDPNLHEAISQAPAAEGVAAGVIVEVAQKGFMMGETVVRPARVVVAS